MRPPERSQRTLFTVTALIEVVGGLAMASLPALAIRLLLGVGEPSPQALVVSRMGGAALLGIAVACWLGRDDPGSNSQRGLLWAALVYNVGAFVAMSFSASVLRMAGVALWPFVGLHAVMTFWCVLNLRAWHARA